MAGLVILPDALRQSMETAAEAAYPNEFCGLILGNGPDGPAPLEEGTGGRVWRITDWRPASNVHPRPDRHFELDPVAHFAVLRALRADPSGPRLLGHVHSHPDAEARPSATDLAMAFDPDMLWLIMSLRQGRAADLTAWLPPTPENPGAFSRILLKTGKA